MDIRDLIAYSSGLLAIIGSIIGIRAAYKGISSRSIDNIKKRYEYFKEIILNKKNTTLAYMGLKEYIGYSISDEVAAYILNSTKMYEVIAIYKTVREFVQFDNTKKVFQYKNGRRPKRWIYEILYFLFLSPTIFTFSFGSNLIKDQNILLVLVSLGISIVFLPFGILMGIEIRNRTRTINFVESFVENKAKTISKKD